MFEIIDAHAHIYPNKIAMKASRNIGEFYGIKTDADGTSERLLEEGKTAGISRFIVHSVATSLHQVHSINEYILSESAKHEEFIPYMTLHPDMSKEEIKVELEWGIENGFRGIKLHPDFQKFAIDGISAHKIYDTVEARLPVLFHTGDKRFAYSHPSQLAKIAAEYPEMICIGAHFGGYSEWEKIVCYEGLENVYFDTSSTLALIGADKAKQLINFLGVQHFFFGTDYPMWNASAELTRFFEIPLSDEERQNILAENIKRLLNLK